MQMQRQQMMQNRQANQHNNSMMYNSYNPGMMMDMPDQRMMT
jgi:hypothetical protein